MNEPPRRPSSGAWGRRAGIVLAVAGLSYGLYLLGARLGVFENGPVVGEPGAAVGGGATDGGMPELATHAPDTPAAPEGSSAPAPGRRWRLRARRSPPPRCRPTPRPGSSGSRDRRRRASVQVDGARTGGRLLAPGWTYVRYRDEATRDAVLAATFTLRAEPMPGEPETVAVPVMVLLQAFQAGKFRVRPKGPVFEIATAGVR